jgi:hypothetical protein
MSKSSKHSPNRHPWIVRLTDKDHRTSRIIKCVGPHMARQAMHIWLQAIAPSSKALASEQEFEHRFGFRTREQARRFQKT